jgi:ATP synthase protein I
MVPPASGGVRTFLRSNTRVSAMAGNDARDGRKDASSATAEDDLSRRLERLGTDLDAKRPAAAPERSGPERSSNNTAIGLAFRLSAEFVAGVIAGGIVGWLIDRMVGSSPWGLIVCLILGFCAGMLNLMRASGAVKPARATQIDKGGSPRPPDQPEV